MNKKICFLALTVFGFNSIQAQVDPKIETNLAGVYQGKTLFIQNPFDRTDRRFCIEKILINERQVDLNNKLSAIKIDFEGFDLYTPVKIRLVHKDSVCIPTIINPEAILFHTIFRFVDISLTDSALVWSTKGETGVGEFEIERLNNGIWVDQEVQQAIGRYEGVDYTYYPNLEEGANKYRVRYNFPRGSRTKYLYSREVDFDFYPEPVEFKPKSAKTRLYLSRSTHYEIYDAGQKMVLEGQGNEIDVTVLRQGQYVIYFNGKDPGTFIKE
ncbi:hypothetical protein SAMN05421640_1148 [Ekhidna lutea]|uniref:Uncharacterized protein n=1 Tax=Ekhidna lutea TaxID=447679 RepID=A0A239H5T4_EKHLU|nr:hypothetical protein [Ekhidna lutea]SNS76531.1 hypothetical protein SAMN05421640_1148 [Ekhidna lutea]